MREDLLSKRLFLAGCLGLPWLWVVHVLYARKKGGEDDGTRPDALLSENSVDNEDQQQDNEQLSPEMISLQARKWIRKCTLASIVVFSLWTAWIILFHVFSNQISPWWYVRSQDDAEATGW